MTQLNVGGTVRETIYFQPDFIDAKLGGTARETLLVDSPIHQLRLGGTVRETLYEQGLYRFSLSDLTVNQYTNPALSDRSVSMMYSDDAGLSWSSPVTRSLGQIGEFLTNVQFRRLGMARSRVIALYWSGEFPTALTGIFLEYQIAGT